MSILVLRLRQGRYCGGGNGSLGVMWRHFKEVELATDGEEDVQNYQTGYGGDCHKLGVALDVGPEG